MLAQRSNAGNAAKNSLQPCKGDAFRKERQTKKGDTGRPQPAKRASGGSPTAQAWDKDPEPQPQPAKRA